MRAVKTIVIVMSVVLVAGFGLLIFGLTQNWHRATEAAAPAPLPGGSMRAWEPATLGQPAGSKVVGMTAAGNLVVLHIALPTGDERIVVVDPTRGIVAGTFTVAQP
jgi:hypothetical protein